MWLSTKDACCELTTCTLCQQTIQVRIHDIMVEKRGQTCCLHLAKLFQNKGQSKLYCWKCFTPVRKDTRNQFCVI